jgi:hypothetical protein
MSITVSSGNEICKHPLNNSVSKQQFSFPKQARFADYAPKQWCSQSFYDLPSTKNVRTTSLGYGNKYDFTSGVAANPAPNNYNPNTTIADEVKNKHFTFGQRTMKDSPVDVSRTKFIPGPGAYDVESTLKKTGVTIASRTPYVVGGNDTLDRRRMPGPGAYKLPDAVHAKGTYPVSKFKNSGACLISPADRFPSGIKQRENPGPGTYELGGLKPDGKYFFSKYASTGGRKFGSPPPKNASLNLTLAPGPGTYVLPSEFGIYASAKSPEAAYAIGKSSTTKHIKLGNTDSASSPQFRISKPQKSNNGASNPATQTDKPAETKPVETKPEEHKPAEAK